MSKAGTGIRVCFFGHYDPDYSRNRIIIKALQRAGATVIEVHSSYKKFTRYHFLFKTVMKSQFDVMFVGFMGHTDMPLAKLICAFKKRPLVFDAFVSLYDSIVWDRQLVKPQSFQARKLYYIDRLAC